LTATYSKGTHFYYKSDEVKQCLRLSNENDDVATSEDLLRNIEHPAQIDIVQAEMLQAHVADVIFGLVTSDPQ